MAGRRRDEPQDTWSLVRRLTKIEEQSRAISCIWPRSTVTQEIDDSEELVNCKVSLLIYNNEFAMLKISEFNL